MREKYEIYGIANCPFCTRASDLLFKEDKNYHYFPLDTMKPKMAKDIMDDSGMGTVPIIYRNGELIGGYTELREHLNG